jgi:transcriptional regulator with XRE-family HTH domain
MKSQAVILLPTARQVLEQFGESIRLARLRRKISTTLLAERAGISRSTLWQIEKGTPTVAIGAYVQVLFVMGLEKNWLAGITEDPLGRKLQDIGLITKKRAPKRRKKSNSDEAN